MHRTMHNQHAHKQKTEKKKKNRSLAQVNKCHQAQSTQPEIHNAQSKNVLCALHSPVLLLDCPWTVVWLRGIRLLSPTINV